jgi:hypothetical protein
VLKYIHRSKQRTPAKGIEIMSKNAIISARILAEMENGKTIDQAYDAVFGEGAYLKLAGELYDQLRAKA